MSDKQSWRLAAFLVLGLLILGLTWNQWFVEAGNGIVAFSPSRGFFWGTTKPLKKGSYLVTANLIPLRAIARRPNVSMFANKDEEPSESFRQVMNPWKPYYVYAYEKGRLRISEQSSLRQEDALWVLESDVYCWTTREVLNIEKPLPIYESLDDARADKNRVKENYVFRYADHAENNPGGGRVPVMAALPVLRREEGTYWSFIRPDPEPDEKMDRPYQICWIRWDGNDASANVRLRITRSEFQEYVLGLQKLLYDWTYGSSEDKAKAHQEMIRSAQRNITGEKDKSSDAQFSLTDLQTRTQGIPHPSGILVGSILNELQADNVRKRLNEALVVDLDRTLWNKAEIAYLEVDRIP